MLFVFDYGDEWRFTVELVKLGEKKPGTRYPRLVGASGDAPEQYPDMDGLGQGPEAGAQAWRVGPPRRSSISACVRVQIGSAAFSFSFRSRQHEQTATPIVGIDRALDQPFPLERLQVRGQRRAVHAEQGRDRPDGRRLGWLSDISSENWPLVSPTGRNTSSKRRASVRAARWVAKHRQWSCT